MRDMSDICSAKIQWPSYDTDWQNADKKAAITKFKILSSLHLRLYFKEKQTNICKEYEQVLILHLHREIVEEKRIIS